VGTDGSCKESERHERGADETRGPLDPANLGQSKCGDGSSIIEVDATRGANAERLDVDDPYRVLTT